MFFRDRKAAIKEILFKYEIYTNDEVKKVAFSICSTGQFSTVLHYTIKSKLLMKQAVHKWKKFMCVRYRHVSNHLLQMKHYQLYNGVL